MLCELVHTENSFWKGGHAFISDWLWTTTQAKKNWDRPACKLQARACSRDHTPVPAGAWLLLYPFNFNTQEKSLKGKNRIAKEAEENTSLYSVLCPPKVYDSWELLLRKSFQRFSQSWNRAMSVLSGAPNLGNSMARTSGLDDVRLGTVVFTVDAGEATAVAILVSRVCCWARESTIDVSMSSRVLVSLAVAAEGCAAYLVRVLCETGSWSRGSSAKVLCHCAMLYPFNFNTQKKSLKGKNRIAKEAEENTSLYSVLCPPKVYDSWELLLREPACDSWELIQVIGDSTAVPIFWPGKYMYSLVQWKWFSDTDSDSDSFI